MRLIDADAMLAELRPITYEMEHSTVTISDMSNIMRNWVERQPTLTPPNEWVSVEERLPEPDFPGQQRGFYLVALSNGTVKELMYEFHHYENMMFDAGWHETAFPITHWMLLPKPPGKDNNVPTNEPLTCEGCYWQRYGSFGNCIDCIRRKDKDNYCRTPERQEDTK